MSCTKLVWCCDKQRMKDAGIIVDEENDITFIYDDADKVRDWKQVLGGFKSCCGSTCKCSRKTVHAGSLVCLVIQLPVAVNGKIVKVHLHMTN